MRIDFFVCNPPFGDQKCSTVGKEIVKHIKEHKAVLICGPTNITSYTLTHITSVENENFPNIDYGTGIFTLNLGEALYKNHYRIKTTTKSNFWVKEFGLHNKIKEPLVIKNNDKSKENNRFYLDITNQQFIELNGILKKEEQNYEEWLKMYSRQLRTPKWIYAEIFNKYGYTNLVERKK